MTILLAQKSGSLHGESGRKSSQMPNQPVGPLRRGDRSCRFTLQVARADASLSRSVAHLISSHLLSQHLLLPTRARAYLVFSQHPGAEHGKPPPTFSLQQYRTSLRLFRDAQKTSRVVLYAAGWPRRRVSSAQKRSPRHEGLLLEELESEAAQEGRDGVASAKEPVNLRTHERKGHRAVTGSSKNV